LKDSPFFKQAELMLKTIPHVAAENCFALKGGTAINLFVRDMPRLSVDIDLAFLPVDEPRETALKKSAEALGRIATAIKKTITGTRVQESRAREPERVIKTHRLNGGYANQNRAERSHSRIGVSVRGARVKPARGRSV
jgi:Nucleotidyl transferase AbiEii toxin, Type IV TA system